MIRTKFFIKPKLQIKYMSITVGIVALSAIVVYVVLQAALRSSGAMENLTPGEWTLLVNAMKRSMYWIVGFIAVVLAVESIFFFHKMVGPLYVFEKVLKLIKAGDLTQILHLRKGDEFKDIASEYNDMIKTISSRLSGIKNSAQKLYYYEDKLSGEVKSDFRKTVDEMKSHLDFFKTQ